MSNQFCPRCGSVAKILLNLVGCLTPACRNYEPKWVQEWSVQNTKHYRHHDSKHNFYGSYEAEGITFDIYYANVKGQGVCFARYGNTADDCYYVDDAQTEIGTLARGAVSIVTTAVQKALKEALRRSPRAKN